MILQLEDATLLGNKDEELLRNISVELHEGERIAVTGPSGSGKSLLLRSLALLEPRAGGELRWRGERVTNDRVPYYRSRVIYLHQRPSLVEVSVELCLKEVFNLQIHKDKRYDARKAKAYLAEIGWPESFLQKPARLLSGGESQLTALLRAIQLDPEVLLLDEPTAALDPERTETVERVVSRWLAADPKRAYLWITHSREQAARVGDRAWVINDGRRLA